MNREFLLKYLFALLFALIIAIMVLIASINIDDPMKLIRLMGVYISGIIAFFWGFDWIERQIK